MMNAVHPRRHNEPIEEPLKRQRQINVGVVEHDFQQERCIPGGICLRPCTKKQDLSRPVGDRNQDLTEVKTDTRGSTKIEIGMVDPVKAPEEWNAMRQDMPEVECVIEQHEASDPLGPDRQLQARQQTKPIPLDGRNQRHDEGALHDLHRRARQGSKGEVSQIVSVGGFHMAPKGTSPLEADEKSEKAKDKSSA